MPGADDTRDGAAGGRTLTVLGCDGSYPGPGGAASGYLVRSGDTALWLDAGPGTFAALQQVVDPGEITAVVLSHEHPDHWTDLESLAVWSLLAPDRDAPVVVHAPPGLRRRSYVAENPVVDWHEITPESTLDIGSLRCRFSRTAHGPTTLAVAIDEAGDVAHAGDVADAGDAAGAGGAADGGGGDPRGDGTAGPALAYSADSGPAWSVSAFGPGAGTFLCEATYTADHEGFAGHLSGRQAGTMAAAAGVGVLVLTHRWPTVAAEDVRSEAEAAFGGPVLQATSGAVFEW